MSVQVLYYTRSGNTKKLADAIAEVAGVDAKVAVDGGSVEADILFLGASVYAYGISKEMQKFISELNPAKVKSVAVFSTSALAERAYPDIKARLEKSGINVLEDNFYCRGKFLQLHKDRPNEKDIQDAKEFAKRVIGE